MGTTTPNISIYVPAAGETNYDQAFLAGMLNVDAHNHTGGPDNGVILGNASLATPYVTIDGTQITLGTPVVNPNWPSRSSFSSYLTANLTNVTGDGTNYSPIPFNAVIWDQNSDFNIGTGVFTAPVTGKYLFNLNLGLFGLLNTHTAGTFYIQTTARAYHGNFMNYYAVSSGGGLEIGMTVMADMTMGDTAYGGVLVSNGTLVVGINEIVVPTNLCSYFFISKCF